MAVRVEVDPVRCRGSQTCITFTGAVFEWPEGAEAARAKLEIVDDPALIELAEEAAESCPTAAI
ncbi:MAG: ferredoxin, partial [Actinobacteria bacterium]|nr:ferredoxin [Actinomycetota bacterium]